MTTAAAEDRDRVGPYRLIKAIGAGGSARIDLARIDRAYNFQRHVVVKRPLEHLRGDAKVADSLRREARIGSLLRHPNLISVLDAGIHDRCDYLVLEYVHGASLRMLMQADSGGLVRELPLGAALAIVVDVARGLHHAHELADEHGASLGLVHRDVSPGNVLLGLDGSVKLADFGIAKETRVTTLSGSMHGTVTYMAPEQCRGHAFDRRADVWALGVILYELSTGARLFWADNDVASLHRVLSGTVPRPRKIKPALHADLEEIVMSALAQDPAKRCASAAELAAGLERYAAGHGELLTARAIAHWVEELIGPRDVPWVGAATMPELPRSDGPLIELIEATGDDAPLDDSFGPSDPVTETTNQPRRRSRVLPLAIGATLSGGVIATWFALRDPDSTARAPIVEEPREPAPPQPEPVPAVADEDDDDEDPVPDVDPTEPVRDPDRKRPTRRRHRATAKQPEKPEKPVAVETGSATGSNPKSRWDPTLLLPTDKGSGKP